MLKKKGVTAVPRAVLEQKVFDVEYTLRCHSDISDVYNAIIGGTLPKERKLYKAVDVSFDKENGIKMLFAALRALDYTCILQENKIKVFILA